MDNTPVPLVNSNPQMIAVLQAIADALRSNYRGTMDMSINNNGSYAAGSGLRIEIGWTAIQGNGTNQLSKDVVFKTPFTAVPIVLTTWGGDTAATTSTLGSGAGSVAAAGSFARVVTTSRANVGATAFGAGTWSSTNTGYVHYIAIGY